MLPSSTRLAALARPTSVAGVKIITAGTQLAHPASLATRMGVLVEEARKIADVILVDTAPLLAASDVFDLLPIVDTVVFVVRSGRLTEGSAQRVSELLGRFHVPVVGAVLVATPGGKANGYGYGYGGSSDDGTAKKRAKRKTRGRRRQSERSVRRTAPPASSGLPSRGSGEPVGRDDSGADGADVSGAEATPRKSSEIDEFDPYVGYDPARDSAGTPGDGPFTETRRQRRASSR